VADGDFDALHVVLLERLVGPFDGKLGGLDGGGGEWREVAGARDEVADCQVEAGIRRIGGVGLLRL
jgi:hypothetical protein